MVPEFDPGSFKDPEGRVFAHRGGIYRTLSQAAATRMRRLQDDGTLADLEARGWLIASRVADAATEGLSTASVGDSVMRHDRIETQTYPFEWSFDMLRDAALVTLDLIAHGLGRSLILKDSTAYNLAFHDGRMVFFDTLSIEPYEDGAPWDGYAQFCREFLFPLLLTSYRGVEFHPLVRGTLSGLPVRQFARLMGIRDTVRPGVLKHVVLQAKLERSFKDTDAEMRSSFQTMKFSGAMIAANVAGLRKLISGLSYSAGDSIWGDYAASHSYNASDEAVKREFVSAAVDRLAPGQLIDLGGNIGDYSLLVADRVARVLCVDIDPACVNTLYRRVREGGVTNVVPIVGDLLNPSPALGWNLTERRDLFTRVRSDAFLALALVHHLCIGGNIPLVQVVEALHRIAPSGVVEWVDKEDAMVRRMLRNRPDVFSDYTWETFRAELSRWFTVAETAETHGGARRLCLLLPKG